MFDQPFITDEHRMVADLYRSFVNKEIMPVRHLIDDDKDHKLIKKILQAMTEIGHQKAAFPEEYGGSNMTATLPASIMHEELGRGDSGIGTASTVTTWAFMPAIMAGNKAVLDRFAPEFCGTFGMLRAHPLRQSNTTLAQQFFRGAGNRNSHGYGRDIFLRQVFRIRNTELFEHEIEFRLEFIADRVLEIRG